MSLHLTPAAPTVVLGVESSCDETAVAIYDGAAGLRAHVLHSQAAMHAEYGGVVPELAARDHVGRIQSLVDAALAESGLSVDALDAIAYTAGPGLIGALLVGAAFAHGLATARGLPVIPVHHLEGHLLAPMLETDAPSFPFVALLVSGGHTLLIEVAGVGRYTLLGETLDDAAGEAFDKTAKLLGLPYPGGPELAKLATRGRASRFHFKRPMTDRPGLDFSFSGLKTAVATTLPADADDATRADIAHAFEESVTETLAIKCARALEATRCERLVVAGGVGANRRLRERLAAMARDRGWSLHFPAPHFCTDNAAMIAYTGWARRSEARPPDAIEARARWTLTELKPPAIAA